MKNILEELRDLLGYDWDYKIEIESLGFTVIISKEMYEDSEIAITYGFEDFPYVNFDKFNNYLKETNQTIEDLDYGYDEDIIITIKEREMTKEQIEKELGYKVKIKE